MRTLQLSRDDEHQARMRLLDEYLSPAQLAVELGISPRTLPRWEALGEAPPKITIGRKAYYHIVAVRTWLKAREQRARSREKDAQAGA
jgi:hypothetical protein